MKRSGRDEQMWVEIHKFMEAMLGIFLYNYLYLKLAKHHVFLLIIFLILLSNWRIRGKTRFCLEVWGSRVVAQIMYMHTSKCKNNKIKLDKNIKARLGC
jgi:hypothetical protein